MFRNGASAALARTSILLTHKQTTVETIASYLDRLASPAPTPGGGSAAAVVGGLGAACLAMVAQLTLASQKYAARHDVAAEIATEADALRHSFWHAVTVDEEAFSAVIAAQKLPRRDEAESAARRRALQDALVRAAAEPLRVAALAFDTLRLAQRTLDLGNTGVASDVACGAEFALAALRASAFNVRINHRYMENRALIDEQAAKLLDLEEGGAAQAHAVIAAVRGTV